MIDEEQVRATLLEHNYQLIELLGSGGFACVYKVWSEQYNMYFAAKVFDIRGPTLSGNISSYTAEIQALMQLSHKNILSVYNHFSGKDYIYMILEFCPNGNLNDHIKEKGMNPEKMGEVCKALVSALSYCHSLRIAHCDIKPSNILFDAHDRLKLADFGLSHKSVGTTRAHRFAGTKLFIAPEVIKLKVHDPFKADVWSLGITFYLMATGHTPWPTHSTTECLNAIKNGKFEIPEDVHPLYANIIKLMLSIDPNDRPNMSELVSYPFDIEVKESSSRLKVRERRASSSSTVPYVSSVATQQILAKPRCRRRKTDQGRKGIITGKDIYNLHRTYSLPQHHNIAPINPDIPLPPPQYEE